MTTRTLRGSDAGPAAELVRIVRDRPADRIDPFPPGHEMEVLADAGARGTDPDRCPYVAADLGSILGYGAVDYSDEMREALLVGPVVHPDHRRQGHGRALLEVLVDQARIGGQREIGIAIGDENDAARALLEAAGFKRQRTRVCLRAVRGGDVPRFKMKRISVRRATDADADSLVAFTLPRVPRSDRQARSLLQTDAYIVLLALVKSNIVGFAEVDLRASGVATLEQVDGESSRIRKGLGNLLVTEAMRAAFDSDGITHFDFLVPGNNHAQIESFTDAGMLRQYELVTYELKL